MAAAATQKGVAPAPSGASIEVMRGFYEGLELAIDSDWFVIGRGRGADAILAEATISRAHAAVSFDAATGFFVQDLGSTNGTLLNGERQGRGPLRDGDQIQIGKLVLRVALPSAGAAK